MKKILILIFTLISFPIKSQGITTLWEYPNHDTLNIDHYQYYLPTELFRRDILGEVEIDSMMVEYISESLKRIDEITYSNKYLGGENYRLTWLRSFHPPIVITVRHEGNEIKMTSKIGNKVGFNNSYYDISKLNHDEFKFYMDYERGEVTDSIIFKAISEKIIYFEDTVEFKVKKIQDDITNKSFDKLKKSIIKNDILNHESITPYELITDGAYWILEMNLKEGYKVIFRHSPDQRTQFRKVCDKIVDLSPFKNEEKY